MPPTTDIREGALGLPVPPKKKMVRKAGERKGEQHRRGEGSDAAEVVRLAGGRRCGRVGGRRYGRVGQGAAESRRNGNGSGVGRPTLWVRVRVAQ